MSEPSQAPNRARQAARNASTGIRRRLGVFLSSSAIQRLRASLPALALALAGFAGGVLLILSEFLAIRYVTTITATCDNLAQPSLRDSCLVVGHESHAWSFLLLGLFAIVMTVGAVAGGARPAAIALVVAGALGLGITLLHDLPQTNHRGQVGTVYARAKAHKGTGFWLELVGSALLIGTGALATWRTPVRRLERRRRVAEPEAAEPQPEAS